MLGTTYHQQNYSLEWSRYVYEERSKISRFFISFKKRGVGNLNSSLGSQVIQTVLHALNIRFFTNTSYANMMRISRIRVSKFHETRSWIRTPLPASHWVISKVSMKSIIRDTSLLHSGIRPSHQYELYGRDVSTECSRYASCLWVCRTHVVLSMMHYSSCMHHVWVLSGTLVIRVLPVTVVLESDVPGRVACIVCYGIR